MNKLFYFIIIVITLCRCSEDFFNPIVEVDIPPIKPKLVLYSLIAAGDQTVTVFLTHSRYPLGINNFQVIDTIIFKYFDPIKMDSIRVMSYSVHDIPDMVTNARVSFYEGNNFITSLTQKDKLYFQSALQGGGIVAGQQYTIKVDAPGYDPIESTTRIPTSGHIDTINYSPNVKHVSSGIDLSTITTDDYVIKLTDPPNETNYFDIAGFIRDTINNQIIQNNYIQLYGIDDFADEQFLTDQGRDGQSVEWKRYSYPIQNQRIYIRLYSISESYYKFKLSADKMFSNRNNPFAEPSILYSNVVNGYGYFAGYSFTEKAFKLR